MNDIQQITTHIRHQQWADDINERIHSGQSVEDYCKENNISKEAYKYRLRVVRRETLAAVPSAFAEVTEPPRPELKESSFPASDVEISIEVAGAVIRFGAGTPEHLISAAVRAVRNA